MKNTLIKGMFFINQTDLLKNDVVVTDVENVTIML